MQNDRGGNTYVRSRSSFVADILSYTAQTTNPELHQRKIWALTRAYLGLKNLPTQYNFPRFLLRWRLVYRQQIGQIWQHFNSQCFPVNSRVAARRKPDRFFCVKCKNKTNSIFLSLVCILYTDYFHKNNAIHRTHFFFSPVNGPASALLFTNRWWKRRWKNTTKKKYYHPLIVVRYRDIVLATCPLLSSILSSSIFLSSLRTHNSR